MAQTLSTMLPLGTAAPDFALPDNHGKIVTLADFTTNKALLLAFICNHCPYVKHIQQKFATVAAHYQALGIGVVAINSNDVEKYPDDSPEKMREEAQRLNYGFPYLFDASQAVAKAYHAACTPDFYLFDERRLLVYRGQFDNARPKNNEAVTGKDLTTALDALLAGKPINPDQKPSVGCNIKWKPGNESNY